MGEERIDELQAILTENPSDVEAQSELNDEMLLRGLEDKEESV